MEICAGKKGLFAHKEGGGGLLGGIVQTAVGAMQSFMQSGAGHQSVTNLYRATLDPFKDTRALLTA